MVLLNVIRYLQLEMMEFKLHELLVASIRQVMMKCNSKGIQTVNGLPEDVMAETLYGDRRRLQQILADFLSVTVNCMPNGGGYFIAVSLTKDRLGESSLHLANIEFRLEKNSIYFFFSLLLSIVFL